MTIVDKAAAKAEPVVTTLYIRSRAQNEKQKQTIPAHRTSERGRRAEVRTTHALRPHVEEFAILEGQIFRCRIRCLNSVSIWSIAFASLCMHCCNWPTLCASNVPAYATDQSLLTNSSSIFVLLQHVLLQVRYYTRVTKLHSFQGGNLQLGVTSSLDNKRATTRQAMLCRHTCAIPHTQTELRCLCSSLAHFRNRQICL